MVRILSILFFALLFFSSCGSAGGGDSPSYNPDGTVEQVDDLFISVDSSTTNVSTNDEAYWSPYGYTLWSLTDDPNQSFSDRTVTMFKQSGDSVAGYGLVICHDYREGYGYTMITAMINTMGRYTIGKVIGAKYESVVEWTSCDKLVKGKGSTNKIRLAYDTVEKEYTLYLNDYEIQKFNVVNPVHESGKNGYIVVVSPQDDFPDVPLNVTFVE